MMLELLAVLTLIYVAPGLVPKSHWSRFYVCYLTYMVHGSFLPTVLIPLQFLSLHLYSVAILNLALLGFKIMKIEWDIRYKYQFKKYQGGILIANHQSIFDVAGILFLNNGLENLTGIAKQELCYIPPIGIFLWKLGIIFINRRKSKEAMDAMRAGISKNKNKKILIFPEGTRNQKGDDLLPFKRGAFRLAIDQKLPIIPVVFSPYTFIKPREEFKDGKVIISCLEPIHTDNLQEEDVDSLMSKTRQIMQIEYFKLSAELGRDNNNKGG